MSDSSSAASPDQPGRGLPFRLLPALVAAAYAAGIWQLSSRTFQSQGSSVFWSLVSNLFHYPLFGGLAVVLAECQRRPRPSSRRAMVTVVILVLAYGIIDELHQASTPGRHPDPADVATDVLGAIGFLSLWWGVRQRVEWKITLRRFVGVSLVATVAVCLQVLRG